MADPTREEIDAKLAATEARIETKLVSLDAKVDRVLDKLGASFDKMTILVEETRKDASEAKDAAVKARDAATSMKWNNIIVGVALVVGIVAIFQYATQLLEMVGTVLGAITGASSSKPGG